MKAKLAFGIVAVILIAGGGLGAAETVWEVLVDTDLQPSTAVLSCPVPGPAPVELLFEEPVPAPAPQVSVPVRLPGFKAAGRLGKGLFDANLVLMVGLNIADYASTREALKYPGLVETNPLMKPFVKSAAAFAAVKAGTTILSYWSMKVIFKRNKTVAWIMTTASNAFLSYVVANNLRLIQAARARQGL